MIQGLALSLVILGLMFALIREGQDPMVPFFALLVSMVVLAVGADIKAEIQKAKWHRHRQTDGPHTGVNCA